MRQNQKLVEEIHRRTKEEASTSSRGVMRIAISSADIVERSLIIVITTALSKSSSVDITQPIQSRT
jgi:hypothetical protein